MATVCCDDHAFYTSPFCKRPKTLHLMSFLYNGLTPKFAAALVFQAQPRHLSTSS